MTSAPPPSSPPPITHQPAAGSTSAHDTPPYHNNESATELLISFLDAHDAPCPVCGYNLRALTLPVCPECRHDLVLTVGAAKPGLGWLLASLAPGFFSGIAALFVLVPTCGQIYYDRAITRPVIIMTSLDLFGWCSGAFAIVLARKRSRFISQPRARQRWWALIIWLIHIFAFVLFIVLGPLSYL